MTARLSKKLTGSLPKTPGLLIRGSIMIYEPLINRIPARLPAVAVSSQSYPM